MGPSSVKDKYQQHDMSMTPKSPQPPSKYAQFSLELCDTPPSEKSPATQEPNSAQRGSVFAREVIRPHYGGITPSYNHASASHPGDTPDDRWTGVHQEVETSQPQSDDPFTGDSFLTLPFGPEITARKSHHRVPSNDSEVEIICYPRKHIKGVDTTQLQAPSSSLLGSKEVLITDVSPGTYHTNHFIHGEKLVFSHVKKPSSAPQPEKKSTRKRKRKARDVYLSPVAGYVVRDETGRELARKFREDASRWWKIVVNPTGRWVDNLTVE